MPNTNRLGVPITSRHHHEQVHVAIFARCAIGVRAEQDDLVGPKFLGNRARVTPDQARRNLGAEIEAFGWKRKRTRLWARHAAILRKARTAREGHSHGAEGSLVTCTL